MLLKEYDKTIRENIVKKSIMLFLITMATLFMGIQEGYPFEVRGNFSAQGRFFLIDSSFIEQERNTFSVAGELELYYERDNFNITFTPFFRLDTQDRERTHFDIRELKYFQSGDNWELWLGLCKVFWGVTESQHLVDIVNQIDQVENPDGEEKLGQPMLYLSFPLKNGTWDLYALPYFRERTFPGKKGRLRSSLVVDTDNPLYEHADQERHVDVALRYSNTFGDVDLGLSYFLGTGREPTMTLSSNDEGQPVLQPFYEQIRQSGLELQWLYDAWLLKFEGIHREGQKNRDGKDLEYAALTAGFEYTFSGINGGMDIGALSELLYDSRDERATTPFEHDIMAGVRLVVNDIQGTEFIFGVIHDLQGSSKSLSFEGSRRITDFWKVIIEANFILEDNKNEIFYDLRNDDFIQCDFRYYF